MVRPDVRIEDVEVLAFEVPTEQAESDGTLEWTSTTIVVVEVSSGGTRGLGYTYSDAAAADVVAGLVPLLQGRDPLDIPTLRRSLSAALRNLTTRGLTQMALSAVDVALWDLKARLLDVPLVDLLGRARGGVPIYGSGGFTSYDIPTLQKELAGFVEQGIARVKMKVGRDAQNDVQRVRSAREAIGDEAELYVDANGAYDVRQALRLASRFADHGVTWFEEPVPSDDLEGLRLLRRRAPAGMDIAAGEYGDDIFYFRTMLQAGAVDVVQPDVTRCGGISGFRDVAALGAAFHVPLSAHTAPQLDAHVCCSVAPVRHAEYFQDHVRIERIFFDGALEPEQGELRPDRTRPGHGLTLKRQDAEPFLVRGPGA